MATIKLQGKIAITGDIQAVTGLHIGGATGGLDIGGVDLPVLRHPLTQQPYIPGSSLRGKLRSLLERHLKKDLNQKIGSVWIHSCKESEDFQGCPVCKVFGVPGERTFAEPSRLIVRDVQLHPDSAKDLRNKKVGLPYTEVKTEVAIDRITSAAVPRQHERVPAGTVFSPLEMMFSVFSVNDGSRDADTVFLKPVFRAMELLEDDYLGGQGSRGSGKVHFQNLTVTLRTHAYYDNQAAEVVLDKSLTVAKLRDSDIIERIQQELGK
jgi:CRISPR-associated protein Csm3